MVQRTSITGQGRDTPKSVDCFDAPRNWAKSKGSRISTQIGTGRAAAPPKPVQQRPGDVGFGTNPARRAFQAGLAWFVLITNLVACHCTFNLAALDSRASHFEMKIAAYGGICGSTSRVTDVDVYRNADNKCLWSFGLPSDKSLVLERFVYGVLPAGFTERQPASPLTPGEELRVHVGTPGTQADFVVKVQ